MGVMERARERAFHQRKVMPRRGTILVAHLSALAVIRASIRA
jgi:hypothetical protein